MRIYAPTLLLAGIGAVIGRSTKPNFIFIMTDDQDMHMNSLDYQQAVQKHFVQEGTWFKKHFCTVSQCCPSRVSLLTGKAAHNTNVTDVLPPYVGGYPKFVEQGFNEDYLPLWLQEAGYNTYYTGKMMNSHSINTYEKPRIKGWNASDFLIDPGTYSYCNASMTRNHEPYRYLPGQYSTDVIADNAVEFLGDAIAASDRPFFLGVAPIGPHSETFAEETPTGALLTFAPPVPAKRHAHLFSNVTIPRTPNFNPDAPGTASYLKTLRQLNQSEIDYNDDWYRKRLQTLQAVEDLVESIMARLTASPEVLANTYLIYTSDNGFHLSQHRLPPGKSCGIEEDTNIPFLIRGPGIAKAAVEHIPSSHTDIVPTLFHLAGIPLRADFDGEPIPVTRTMQQYTAKSEHVNIEFWGLHRVEGNIFFGQNQHVNNTYKTVRVISDDYNLAYTVWCTNEHELYDMTHDPYQMTNLYNNTNTNTNTTLNTWPIQTLKSRLNALLLTLKRCKGRDCTRPWTKLHPRGNVKNLKDAMHMRYDKFYLEHQPPVTFSECALGQILGTEGSLEPVAWREEWDSWSWAT
ncbi:arylsulfatase precursor [Decorospora gaudefroyi]|uniref:Arylsulfatase n=1 Tax=Decorospora gaudefroyi TaxID=184978 RepID=A0A6A5K4P5_9PLEO|nr:arylsulfatase precursor [Decorospora gaudefroyi]